MAAFSEFSFAARWLGRLSKASTTSNSTINLKLLTTAVMVDNLAEKVDKCLLNRGCSVLLAYNWDSIIRSSGYSGVA